MRVLYQSDRDCTSAASEYIEIDTDRTVSLSGNLEVVYIRISPAAVSRCDYCSYRVVYSGDKHRALNDRDGAHYQSQQEEDSYNHSNSGIRRVSRAGGRP